MGNASLLYNGYLGGHNWVTHTDEGSIKYLQQKLNIKSMIDIGCGPGGQIEVAKSLGIEVIGVDGDPRIINEDIILCDYTQEKYVPSKIIDLAWSTEFLEHVEEQYMDNYFETFKSCRYVFVTHALPGTESKHNHHVNCKEKSYWVSHFHQRGFSFDEELTQEVRDHSTMKRDFVRDTGLFFRNENNL